jgi:hypothetical protein
MLKAEKTPKQAKQVIAQSQNLAITTPEAA